MGFTQATVGIAFLGFFCNVCFAETIVECVQPYTPSSGSYTPIKDKYLPTDKITYKCDEGFLLIGDKERTCRTTARWTKKMPFCDSPVELQNQETNEKEENGSDRRNLSDKDTESCFRVHGDEGPRISLKNKLMVNVVRLVLPRGKYNVTVENSAEKGNKHYCGTLVAESKKLWTRLDCEKPMLADTIYISPPEDENNVANSNRSWTVCEVEVYGYDELSCKETPKHPPTKGHMTVSRKQAFVKCTRTDTGPGKLHLVCEDETWVKVESVKCGGDTPVLEIATIVMSGIVVLGCLIVAAVTFYTRIKNPVVVVVKQPDHLNSLISSSSCRPHPRETEYDGVNYEEIPLPELPKRRLPQNVQFLLPDILVKTGRHTHQCAAGTPGLDENSETLSVGEYSEPQDSVLGHIPGSPASLRHEDNEGIHKSCPVYGK